MTIDGEDDATILAVGRAVGQRGGLLRFEEAQEVEEGFKVTATLQASVIVPLQNEIAHGRAMALKLLLKGRSEI